MLNIGIDAVEISRFEHWYNYSDKILLKIFSHNEIEYCKSNKTKSAERFAARFVAKEAFYKAICPLLNKKIPFLIAIKNIEVIKSEIEHPIIIVNWQDFSLDKKKEIKISCSLTHTKTTAFAAVILF